MKLQDAYLEVLGAMEDAKVPETLQEVAFSRGLDHLLVTANSSAGPAAAADSPASDAKTKVVVDDPLQQIADRMGLSRDIVADVYHSSGDDIGIGLAPSKLSRSSSAAAKQIALLLAAGRQAALGEEYTPQRVIRDATRDFGRLDSANFATSISEMRDTFLFKGKKQQREVRLTKPGWEEAARLLKELTGNS